VGQSAPLSPKYEARKHEIFFWETSSTATNKPLDLKSTLVEFLAGGSFLPTFDFTLCKKKKKGFLCTKFLLSLKECHFHNGLIVHTFGCHEKGFTFLYARIQSQ
jgi:hypothetical protein